MHTHAANAYAKMQMHEYTPAHLQVQTVDVHFRCHIYINQNMQTKTHLNVCSHIAIYVEMYRHLFTIFPSTWIYIYIFMLMRIHRLQTQSISVCMYIYLSKSLMLNVADIASLTPLFSWLKGVLSGIYSSSKKKLDTTPFDGCHKSLSSVTIGWSHASSCSTLVPLGTYTHTWLWRGFRDINVCIWIDIIFLLISFFWANDRECFCCFSHFIDFFPSYESVISRFYWILSISWSSTKNGIVLICLHNACLSTKRTYFHILNYLLKKLIHTFVHLSKNKHMFLNCQLALGTSRCHQLTFFPVGDDL